MDLSLAKDGLIFLGAFCERHGPSLLLCSSLSTQHNDAAFVDPSEASAVDSAHQSSSPCGGCRSLAPDQTLVLERGRWRCTTAKFPATSLYATVRQACVRSLSCEHVPGREGPVLFGEDGEGGGLVLSLPFTLADSQSRGFSRMYALCLAHRDAALLLSALRFVTAAFGAVQRDLRTRALRLFEEEQRLVEAEGSSRVSLRRVHKATTVRPLADLVGAPGDDVDLFSRLHASFADVLLQLDGPQELPPPQLAGKPAVALHQLVAALGVDRFAVLAAVVLAGGALVVCGPPSQQALCHRVCESLQLLSPRRDGVTVAERGGDGATLEIAEGARLLFVAGGLAQARAGTATIVRDVVAIVERRLRVEIERMLVEAALCEFGAATTAVSESEWNRKVVDAFGITEADRPFVAVWKKS